MRPGKSETATSIVSWFYDSQKDAFRALLSLQQIERKRGLRSVGVIDAAVMSETEHGTLNVDRTIVFREGMQRDLSIVFPPWVLEQPALGADNPLLREHFSSLGFGVNVLREIGENLTGDGAALVVWIEEAWLYELQSILQEYSDVERWALETIGRAT